MSSGCLCSQIKQPPAALRFRDRRHVAQARVDFRATKAISPTGGHPGARLPIEAGSTRSGIRTPGFFNPPFTARGAGGEWWWWWVTGREFASLANGLGCHSKSLPPARFCRAGRGGFLDHVDIHRLRNFGRFKFKRYIEALRDRAADRIYSRANARLSQPATERPAAYLKLWAALRIRRGAPFSQPRRRASGLCIYSAEALLEAHPLS